MTIGMIAGGGGMTASVNERREGEATPVAFRPSLRPTIFQPCFQPPSSPSPSLPRP